MTSSDPTTTQPLESVAEILVNVLLRRLTEDKRPTGVEKT